MVTMAMKKLSRSELEEIIKRERPGRRIVDPPPQDDAPIARPAPDAVSPSAEAIRQKYRDGAPEADVKRSSANDTPANDAEDDVDDFDDVIVPLDAEDAPADPWDRGRRAKSVIVSGREGTVIGEQG